MWGRQRGEWNTVVGLCDWCLNEHKRGTCSSTVWCPLFPIVFLSLSFHTTNLYLTSPVNLHTNTHFSPSPPFLSLSLPSLPLSPYRHASIHQEAPEFVDMSIDQEILVTGIKVVDLLAPYVKGGKIGEQWGPL